MFHILLNHIIVCCILVLFMITGICSYGQTFSTTSSGTIGANSSPTGWSAISSPDYSSISINGYNANTNWTNTLPAAPNGDTTFPVVRSTSPSEGISQTITGLTTGVAYTFSIHYMYPTAVGTYATRFNRPVYQLAYARFNNGVNQYLDSFGYAVSANQWFTQTFTVVSTGSTMLLELGITGLNSNRAAVAFSLTSIVPPTFLPIDLLSFTAEITSYHTTATVWTTASEIDNRGFEIQRSFDNANWLELGFILGTNMSSEYTYHFEDKNPHTGENFYRLVQYDFNGNRSYSSTQMVDISQKSKRLNIYPNPTQGQLHIALTFIEKPLLVEIVDIEGTVVFSRNVMTPTIDLGYLRAGFYMVTCFIQGEAVHRAKFLKE